MNLNDAAIAEAARWVCYRQSNGLIDKTPINPRTLNNAQNNNPQTWATKSEARNAGLGGLGLELGEVNGVAVGGVDLDAALIDDEFLPWAREIITLLNTYTEVSPSGTGAKAFFTYDPADIAEIRSLIGSDHKAIYSMPGERIKKPPQVEVHISNSYFTVTGIKLPEAPSDLNHLTLDAWVGLIGHLRMIAVGQKDSGGVKDPSQVDAAALMDEVADLQLNPEKLNAKIADRAGARLKARLAGDWDDFPTGTADRSKCAWYMIAGLKALGFLCSEVCVALEYCEVTFEWLNDKGQRDAYRQVRNIWQCLPPPPPPGERIIKREWNDIGLGERLKDQFGEKLRHIAQLKKWHAFDGMRWQMLYDIEAQQYAKLVARSIHKEENPLWRENAAKPEDEQDVEMLKLLKNFESFVKYAHTSKGQDSIMKFGKAEVAARQEMFDRHPDLFVVGNGTIDLLTGEIRECRPEDMLTKASPKIKFDANAHCPKFEAFLDQIFEGDTALIHYVLKLIGLCLTGYNKHHEMYFFYGAGRNGKSVLIKIVEAILGEYAQSAPMASFMKKSGDSVRNDLAAFSGARLITAHEADEENKFDEALAKRLTGGDKVVARFLYAENFELDTSFKIWLVCNHMPTVKGTDFAFWRRVRVIPFNWTVPKELENKNLDAELLGELSGILNLVVRGCLDWKVEGLKPPAAVIEATAAFRERVDVIAEWLKVNVAEKEGAELPVSEAFDDYLEFAGANGYDAVTKKIFGSMMADHKHVSRPIKRAGRVFRAYKGLELKQPF